MIVAWATLVARRPQFASCEGRIRKSSNDCTSSALSPGGTFTSSTIFSTVYNYCLGRMIEMGWRPKISSCTSTLLRSLLPLRIMSAECSDLDVKQSIVSRIWPMLLKYTSGMLKRTENLALNSASCYTKVSSLSIRTLPSVRWPRKTPPLAACHWPVCLLI